MKRILFPDGAVLAHPFEIAERAQAYAAENAAELLSVLFERFGVLAPNTEELAVSVERDQRYFSVRSATAVLGDRDDDLFLTEKTTGLADVQVALDDTGNRQPVAPGVRATDRAAALSLRVNAGMAVVSRGPLALTSAVTVSVSKREHLSATTPEKTLYVNLLYAEREDTPVELLPHGSGQSNLRRYGTYRIAIEASQPDPSVGVALARVLLKSSGSVVTDLRSANSARLRVDATLTDETIDPDLVPEIERLLARTGVVDEILNLLQNGRLGTGYVVTEPGIAAPPLFVRTRREPAFRQAMRQRSVAASADKTLWTGRALPDPTWELTVDWNLYGVQVEKLSANSFRIHSGYDLTAIVIDPNLDPLFLRFVGVDYPVASVTSANTVQTVQNVGGATTVDSLGALHNGVDEVYVQAEPERGIKHLSAEKPSQLVVDHSKSESMRARLRLPDGTWRVTLHGASKERRSKHTLTQPLPSLPAPLAVASVTATPYQAEPAYDIVAPKAANPFEKVQIGANGEAAVDTSGVDRFVESVQDELKRIQELEVGLTVAVAFSPRTQFDGVFGGQITAGLRLRVEMLTLKGWKPVSEKEVYRPVDDIVREVAWVDLNTNLYRGAVGTVTALASLDTNLSALPSFVAGDTVKDSEIVRVTADPDAAKNGYYRSESRLSVAPSGSESVARPAGGYWVKVSLTQASFQPAPVTVFFDRLAGGADYRVTVWPVGEMADIGPSTVVTTEKMRSLYNARLGTNLHRTMNDMYQTFSLLMEQVDPARLDAYHDELIGRLHEAVQQASVYGNPPRIEGPFKVNATPPPTVFTGTNLGSVTSVTMRYVPAGKADEQSVVVEADFVINQSAGTTPSILVRNLPEYTDLNPRYPPAVTLVFDARIKGQGIAVVRYETTELQVYGPTAAIFKGLETRKPAGAATIGNTASHYGYFPLHASGSRHVGPLPKVWPSGAQTFLTAHPYLTTNKTDAGETVAPQTALAQCLRFDVNGFLPGLLLDVRVRAVPSESLLRQQAFGAPATSEKSRDFGKVTSELWDGALTSRLAVPVYHQIEINEKTVNVWVEEAFVPTWVSKNFVLEFVYYDGPVVGDNCRGLNLSNLGVSLDSSGTGAAPPNTTGTNGDYLVYPSGSAWVKRAGSWVAATPLRFNRHQFSVLAGSTSTSTLSKADTLDVLVDVSAVVESNGGPLTPILQVRELPSGQIVSGASPVQVWTKEQELVEVVAPATISSGGTYTFARWEMGDGTTNGWVFAATNRTSQIVARAPYRFVRAVYTVTA